jgi:hypothetical protein
MAKLSFLAPIEIFNGNPTRHQRPDVSDRAAVGTLRPDGTDESAHHPVTEPRDSRPAARGLLESYFPKQYSVLRVRR